MTLTTTDDDAHTTLDVVPRRRRRRPAPPAHPFFQYVFPMVVVAAGVIVFLLWRDGARAVLDTTDGEDVSIVTDPSAPGFLAFATPTPTLLVAHVDTDDALVGVTVLARTALDAGGSLVVFSPDMLLDLRADDVILRRVYAEGGVEALELAIGEFMGFGFTDDPMVMEPARLAAFFELVEPITYFLADDLVEVDDGVAQVVYESGFDDFDGATMAAIFAWRNPDEVDAARFTRQESIWKAWLARVDEAEDPLAATLPFDDQLPPFLRSLGTGTADVSVAPVVPLGFDGNNPLYALTAENLGWPREKALEMVPVPIGYTPGARPTVQLLDGTGVPANRERVLPVLVAAGAQISIIGNAFSFDVEETFVSYHIPEDEARGREFAGAIGVPVVFDDNPSQPATFTVTVGADAADVIASSSD